ncbi:MAG TPA: hypothetical protein VD993_19975 [Chitinophagaceae bacterium]|nr:hypothetical protein [Chitinophagaceae bacterium]
MKKVRSFVACLLIVAGSYAQEITEGKIDYQRKDQPALIMEVPYPPEVVEDAIKDYLNRRGSKASSSRGFQLFKGTKLSDLDTEGNDLYFKVERKSRKEKDASVVYLFVTRPNENPTTRVATETPDLSSARSFLQGMMPSVEAYNLEVDIAGQENAVKKAEKRYDRLQEDASDMQKRLKKLENDIEDNKKEQEKQKQEIERQKNMLESMKGKRKG